MTSQKSHDPGRTLALESLTLSVLSAFVLERMDEYVFNVDNGYLEGLVRGFRSGILNRADYLNLVQCETVEGIGGLKYIHTPTSRDINQGCVSGYS